MASIEEDLLRDVYQMVSMIARKLNRRRNPRQAQRMRDAGQREAARSEELRALVEQLMNERQHNPEFDRGVENLSDDQRSALFEAEAQRVQENRDRLDNEPTLTPEALERERDERDRDRDRDGNGLDDNRDRELRTDEIVDERIDPNRDGEVDAVQQRQAEQEARDAQAQRERQERENAEQRETEEARGGDALPAAAAAGATAVAADEILDEVEEQRQTQELEDQQQDEQTQVLDEDGAAPEAEQDDRVLDEGGAAPEVIGETEAERDARLAEPEAEQDDRVLDEGGAAPEVIGETDQERDARLAEPAAEQDDRILDEDGAAPEVIGETDQERDARLAEPEAGQDDRVLDEDGAAPAVIGEDAQQAGVDQDERGEAGPQPGLPTGGDQVAASQEEEQNEQRRPDAVETTLQEARDAQQNNPNGQSEPNGQRQISDEELDKLRGFQEGHADASEATRPRSGEPVEVGAGGKNPGARAADLRSDKGSRRDGPGIGE